MGANWLVQPRVLGTCWLKLLVYVRSYGLYPSLRLLMETVGFAQAKEKCGPMMLIKTLA